VNEEKKGRKYRLVTRSDFDGLACAVLLKEKDLIEDITFVHPKDMQDGLIEISDRDIITNLPYVKSANMVFDHHSSEIERIEEADNLVLNPESPSAARVVYNYFGGRDAFPHVSEDMMEAVDRTDSANLSVREILDPEGWILLNFIMDARTGLGRFKNFRISNYQLMMALIDYCRKYTIDEILAIQDVAERINLYREHQELFQEQIRKRASVEKNVLTVDLRNEDTIYAGNRFIKYALYPETDVSIQVNWGFKKQNTVFSVGKSIVKKTFEANIGDIMYRHGGGGHAGAGTCQISNEEADVFLEGLKNELKEK
jgi:nanoRNase/pAp phosphatase (c-di-AMP/oligoRNAs hydrolase)